jgi:hypothetical protein
MSEEAVIRLAPGVDVIEFAAALEACAEEAEIHARREPGYGAGCCGDKFCTHASHATMAWRAGVLEGTASLIRSRKERDDTRADVRGAPCSVCGAKSLGSLDVDHPAGSCGPEEWVKFTIIYDLPDHQQGMDEVRAPAPPLFVQGHIITGCFVEGD